jgi:S-adenosylmethionine decarboxylase
VGIWPLSVGSRGLIWRLFALRFSLRVSLSVAPVCRHLGFLNLVGEDGMSQNALLRSVKGLGIPGAARKEDKKSQKAQLKVASPARDDEHAPAPNGPTESHIDHLLAKDHFALRNGVRCAGVHLIIDLHGAKRLNDIEHIEATLRRCVEAASATLLHIHLHHFQPSGVSGVAVLAESHISIHTWPEAGYAALDVFMCGSADPDKCIPVLREAFSAKRVGVNELLRGQKT